MSKTQQMTLWSTVLYGVESHILAQIEPLTQDNNVKDVVIAYHDHDVDGNRQPIDPHWHVVLRTNTPVSAYWIAKRLGVNKTSIRPASDHVARQQKWGNMLAYLTHFNAPDKYQYPDSAVQQIKGNDWVLARNKVARTVVRHNEKRLNAHNGLLDQLANGTYTGSKRDLIDQLNRVPHGWTVTHKTVIEQALGPVMMYMVTIPDAVDEPELAALQQDQVVNKLIVGRALTIRRLQDVKRYDDESTLILDVDDNNVDDLINVTTMDNLKRRIFNNKIMPLLINVIIRSNIDADPDQFNQWSSYLGLSLEYFDQQVAEAEKDFKESKKTNWYVESKTNYEKAVNERDDWIKLRNIVSKRPGYVMLALGEHGLDIDQGDWPLLMFNDPNNAILTIFTLDNEMNVTRAGVNGNVLSLEDIGVATELPKSRINTGLNDVLEAFGYKP